MSSYDNEKPRVRGALAQSSACVEQPNNGGKLMECRSQGQALQLTLWENLQNGVSDLPLTVSFYQMNPDGNEAWPELVKLAGLYDFSEDDLKKCMSDNGYAEQAAAFRVQCTPQPMSGASLQILVSPKRAV